MSRRTGDAAAGLAALLLLAAPASGAATSWHGWERELVLEASTDRRSAWLGEQVALTVEVSSAVAVTSLLGYRPPPYEGFWAEPLQTPSTISSRFRYRHGLPYRVYLLREVALFPTRAGRLTLGPPEAELEVDLGSADARGRGRELRRVIRHGPPLAVDVRPLPPDAPAGFEAVNVGELSVSRAVSRTEAKVGEAVVITVRARGRGNLRALSLPRLAPLAGAEALEPVASIELAPEDGRIAGEKRVENVLLPRRAGELVVPAVAWPYFDPREGRYETIALPALRISIAEAAGQAPRDAAPLAPLKKEPRFAARWRGWEPPLLASALLAPPLLAAVMAAARAIRRRRARSEPARRRDTAAERARHRLDRIRRRGPAEPGLACEEIAAALLGFARDRLERDPAPLSRGELLTALAATGVPASGAAALCDALDVCDAARFGRRAAPASEVLARAERALAALASREAR